MHFIPRSIHGLLDYTTGIILLFSPWLLGFEDRGPATYIPVAIGFMMIALAALTRFEAGLIKLIPFPVHLMIDFASGLLLALSPWLFGFAYKAAEPHVMFGLFE